MELFVPVRRAPGATLRAQLERHLREAVRSGRLRPSSALPSTRALATQLQISRGVVVEAYDQLAAEGYLVARPCSATRVADAALEGAAAARPAAPPSATEMPAGSRPCGRRWPPISGGCGG
jgi:GntR family transcriptional regulator / MocR family aminotransferase